MRVHFIAIGGAVMHQLAIALKKKGYDISGSDDEIFDPAKDNLEKAGLLPSSMGWNADRISEKLDAIVLGMHAGSDNPELIRANQLGLRIYSYPEFLYEQSRHKLRVVIAGSHGKTTITSMIIHILVKAGKKFDYLVGARVPGLNEMIRISDADLIIFEGDEYPDSAVNRLPKFLVYRPQIVLISGIAWDHINIYPTFESYLLAFRELIDSIPADGTLIYNEDDHGLQKLVSASRLQDKKPYSLPDYLLTEDQTMVKWDSKTFPLRIFGKHNLQNAMGAIAVCRKLGVEEEFAFQALHYFKGAAKRLQLLSENEDCSVFLDFAHAPSKVRATVNAVRERFPHRTLIACFELHTFSSLNPGFLSEYKNTLSAADEKIVFYNAHTFELKKMAVLKEDFVQASFAERDLQIFTDGNALLTFLKNKSWQNSVLLLMSSGNFGGMNIEEFANFVCPK